jgi:putative ubiquitin-RnfH superfamily antitoxin RatB of RatAB toxin-antitoxin module
MADAEPLLGVEVAYALPHRQWLWTLRVRRGSTVADAIAQSGCRIWLPDVSIDDHNVGIFSRPVTLATPLREGDRVEIYRPLQIDPKDARRKRAAESRQKRPRP